MSLFHANDPSSIWAVNNPYSIRLCCLMMMNLFLDAVIMIDLIITVAIWGTLLSLRQNLKNVWKLLLFALGF